MGKGSKRRPTLISEADLEKRWGQINWTSEPEKVVIPADFFTPPPNGDAAQKACQDDATGTP